MPERTWIVQQKIVQLSVVLFIKNSLRHFIKIYLLENGQRRKNLPSTGSFAGWLWQLGWSAARSTLWVNQALGPSIAAFPKAYTGAGSEVGQLWLKHTLAVSEPPRYYHRAVAALQTVFCVPLPCSQIASRMKSPPRPNPCTTLLPTPSRLSSLLPKPISHTAHICPSSCLILLLNPLMAQNAMTTLTCEALKYAPCPGPLPHARWGPPHTLKASRGTSLQPERVRLSTSLSPTLCLREAWWQNPM